MKILVFGDSIAQGYYDEKVGGWVQRLTLYLWKKAATKGYDEFYDVENLGISGDSTRGVLNRMALETEQRLFPQWDSRKDTMIMIGVGGNDTEVDSKTMIVGVSASQFANNVRKMIKTAKRYAAKVVYVGLSPVDDSKTIPIPWYPEYSYIDRYFKGYNEMLKKICKAEKIYFIDNYASLQKMGYKETLDDGVHPNSRGHQMIFKLVKEYLESKKLLNR